MFNVGDKDRPIDEVRSVLEYLDYKITGSGEYWFVIEGRLVVQFDGTDSVLPFAIADVNGFLLAYDYTVKGITRSAIYCLEMK